MLPGTKILHIPVYGTKQTVCTNGATEMKKFCYRIENMYVLVRPVKHKCGHNKIIIKIGFTEKKKWEHRKITNGA